MSHRHFEGLGGIQLTDDERYREPIAEVVAVGPDCDPIVQPGDRWVYLNGACKKSQPAKIGGAITTSQSWFLVSELRYGANDNDR